MGVTVAQSCLCVDFEDYVLAVSGVMLSTARYAEKVGGTDTGARRYHTLGTCS